MGMMWIISVSHVLIFQYFSIPIVSIGIGKAQKLLDGKDVTIIATGSMVYEALQVAQSLIVGGKTVDFLNIHTIKPLDGESIITSAQKTGKVVVIEEHNIHGGLGDAVASAYRKGILHDSSKSE
jgi:transketolase